MERLLEGVPGVNLRLASTKVLDQRLVLLDYQLDQTPDATLVGRRPVEGGWSIDFHGRF